MNLSLLLFVLLGCILMALAMWNKLGGKFQIKLIAAKLIFGFVAGAALCFFIDQPTVQKGLVLLATMGIIYATYVIPGIKNL